MSGYIGTQPVPQSTQTRQTFTATASQTSFATGGYQAGYLDVFLNGVKLVDGTDYTATNGSDVVLTTGAASGDTLEVVAYTAFEVLNQNFTGGVTVDNDAATVLTVDRATSDGTIIDLQKDGTSVGSIGANSGTRIYIGSGDANLTFNPVGNYVFPSTSTGGGRDAQLDLGLSAARFKDLYLSGGVYLGGTGSANKLDDYEEGIFVPTIIGTSSNPSVTYTRRVGTYVKVGRVVHCSVHIQTAARSGGSGGIQISNFPFTCNASDISWYSGTVAYTNNFSAAPTRCMINDGTSKVNLYTSDSTSNPRADHSTGLTVPDWPNAGDIYFSISYETNS